ncbi:MAG: HD-GYP domain-containing protein, partial [Desulfitobacteriaceae bacterium]|nr:HD-GYP domain-containing protein [Desulfitobacteriaceae bacterium]
REKLHRIHSVRSNIVQALLKALETRDIQTEEHSKRLGRLIIDLAKAAGIPEQKFSDLYLFAQFHDIGKVGIPDSILFKPEKLSHCEELRMKAHCEIGKRIALASPDLVPIADWILKHHEWWNGEGYPMGLKGNEIPLECRILAIVDAYDAMVNDRLYKKAVSHETALAELSKCAGTQFNPELVEVFINKVSQKDMGTFLQSGQVGEIDSRPD